MTVRLRTVYLVTLAASGVCAALACSNTSENDPGSTTASQIRNDGKEPNGTNPGKLSCADHGFSGIDTVVDLGGVNRTLDLGGGNSCTISNVKKGPSWNFDFDCNIAISMVLMRSGNLDSFATISPPSTSGHVTRAEAVGSETNPGTKPGLNRIAFCFVPPTPPPHDAGKDGETPPPPDAGETDSGRTW